MILDGDVDHIDESAFRYKGGMDEVIEAAKED